MRTIRLQITALLVFSLLVLPGCDIPGITASPEPPTSSSPAPAADEPATSLATSTATEPETAITLTVQSSETIKEANQPAGLISREYTWEYAGKEWAWELDIPQSLYEYYKGIPRPPTPNYSIYVTHPQDDILIEYLVSQIEKTAQEEGFSHLEKVGFTASFVQNLLYTADSVTTAYDEYPRYPVETLVDNGGDCEDTSILLASLLNAMGYGSILIVFPGNHAAVGVLSSDGMYGTYYEYGGDNYFYLETTDSGWRVGEIPEELEGTPANLYGMTPIAILTHTWTAMGDGRTFDLKITIENLGTAAATDVYVLAGFDAGENKLWNARPSPNFELPTNERIVVTLSLQVPLGKYTRLMVQIIDDGHAVDESYSEWVDT